MLPSCVGEREKCHVDAVDDGNAMHAAVEHLFQDLEERVVWNAKGQLTAVRIHEIWGKSDDVSITSILTDIVV